jgi:aspartyl-tRNA(Asn)/glutamyl-tRNA(Gln) amidotransferase subunit C
MGVASAARFPARRGRIPASRRAAHVSLDEATVARIARLARIAVPEDELAPLAGELSRILEWIAQLSEVDTADVAPMTSVVPMKLAWRDDRVTDGGRAEDILANAPARQDDYFVVPKVVE